MPFVLDPTHGEYSRTRKITARDAEIIRELSAAGIQTKAICTAFDLSQPQVDKIIRKRAWKGFYCHE